MLDDASGAGEFVHAVTGYVAAPTVLQAAAYFLYIFGVGTWYLWGFLGRKFRRLAAEQPSPVAPSPAAHEPR